MFATKIHEPFARSCDPQDGFLAEILVYDHAMFVWVDEIGATPSGNLSIPPHDYRLLAIGGVRYSGIGVMSIVGTLDAQLVQEQ